MKRLVFAVVIVALLGSLFAYLAMQQPGYILIQWFGYSAELTVWLFLITALVLYGVFRLAWFVTKRVLGLPVAASNWLFRSDDAALQSMTAHALAAFEEGHWQRARKLLDRVAQHSKNPLIFYLLAARASHAEGEQEHVSRFLKKATEHAPKASSMAVNLTQAQLQLADGALENCLATLVRAQAMDEEHPEVIRMLAKVYLGLKDWQQLQSLLPQLRRLRLFAADEYKRYEEHCFAAILAEAANEGLQVLESQWKRLPRSAKESPSLVLLYGKCLSRFTDAQQSLTRVLENALAIEPTDELLLYYSGLACIEAGKSFQFLQAQEPNVVQRHKAAYYLALSRLALRLGLKGQAASYLKQANNQTEASTAVRKDIQLDIIEAAVKTGATPEVKQALAQLRQT